MLQPLVMKPLASLLLMALALAATACVVEPSVAPIDETAGCGALPDIPSGATLTLARTDGDALNVYLAANSEADARVIAHIHDESSLSGNRFALTDTTGKRIAALKRTGTLAWIDSVITACGTAPEEASLGRITEGQAAFDIKKTIFTFHDRAHDDEIARSSVFTDKFEPLEIEGNGDFEAFTLKPANVFGRSDRWELAYTHTTVVEPRTALLFSAWVIKFHAEKKAQALVLERALPKKP